MNAAAHMMAQHPERWCAVGTSVYAEQDDDPATWDHPRARERSQARELRAQHHLGDLRSPALAQLVVLIHNTYLPLARELVMLQRRVADMEIVRER